MRRRNLKLHHYALAEQLSHDATPLRIERLPAYWLACATVPIRRVVLIAFLAMQVGMNPRTIPAFVLLGGFVRPLPISFRIPPQSGECVGESRWRLGRGEGLTEFVQRYFHMMSEALALRKTRDP